MKNPCDNCPDYFTSCDYPCSEKIKELYWRMRKNKRS